MSNFKGYIFDFEVFKHYWTVLFLDIQTQEVHEIRSDQYGTERLREFVDRNKNALFVGFNNKNYDNNLIKAAYVGLNLYDLSQWIIAQGQKAFTFPGMRSAYNLPIITFDVKNDAIKNSNMALSLKEYEAYVGANIHESSIPFDLDRPLTEEEKQLTYQYCLSDVRETLTLFKEPTQQQALEAQLSMCQLVDMPLHKTISKTNAQLTALILKANKVKFNDDDIYDMPANIQIQDQRVVDFFTKQPLSDTMKLEIEVNGVVYIFGLGGIHGAPKTVYNSKARHLNFDVGSYYPSLIIQYNYYSRGITDPSIYANMKADRIKLKKAGNPLANTYKLVLNTKYGAMDSEFNELFDTRMRRAIAITGQLLLWDLIEKVQPYCDIINANTDGILVKPHSDEDEEKLKVIMKEWEVRARMEMEMEVYNHIIQSDVNNYIIIGEDGHPKVKGAAVKFYKQENNYNRQARIIYDAVVDYLVYGTPVEQTIMNCTEIRDLMFVCKATHLYSNVFMKDKDGNMTEVQRVNRVFPTKNENGVELVKYRMFKDKPQYTKFMNAPEKAIIVNDDIRAIKGEFVNQFLNAVNIDWQYYIDEANHRIKKFQEGANDEN